MDEKTIERKAKVWLGNDNILTIQMLPKSDINEDDVKEIVKVANEIVQDKVHCNLADVREMTFMSKKARDAFGAQNKKTVLAVAIVSNSKLHKSLINLYFKFTKPIIPSKVFDDIDKAKNWLLTHMN